MGTISKENKLGRKHGFDSIKPKITKNELKENYHNSICRRHNNINDLWFDYFASNFFLQHKIF